MVTIGPPASNTTISIQTKCFFIFDFPRNNYPEYSKKLRLDFSQFFFVPQNIPFHSMLYKIGISFTKFTEWLTDWARKLVLSKRTGFVNVSTQTDDTHDDRSRTLSSFSMMALKSCVSTNRMRAHIPTILLERSHTDAGNRERVHIPYVYRCWWDILQVCLFASLSDENDFRWKSDI